MTTEEIFKKILDILSRNPDGVPQPYIHRSLGLSKAYISILLRNMEKQGIVYRVKVGNTYVVKLTKRVTPTHNNLRLGIVWSSEYLFLGHFAKLLRDSLNINLTVSVYPSAIQATSAIIRGEVNGVLSPLMTQLYAYILTRGIVIVGGGAGGGAMVFEFPKSGSDVIISSEASSMDLCRFIATRKGIVEYGNVRYFGTPNEALEIIKRGRARYAVIWHPLTTFTKLVTHRVVAECGDFEEMKHCCTLALSRTMDTETVEKVSEIYRVAIDAFLKQPLRYVEWYSSITGIDTALLKEALRIYRYAADIEIRSVKKVLETLNLDIPQKDTVLNNVLLFP